MTDESKNSTRLRMAELISRASAAGIIKKCTLSVPLAEDVKNAALRTVVIGGARMIQAETFMRDGKALQKNLPQNDTAAICDVIGGYLRLNLILSANGGVSCEYRANAKGRCAIIGESAVARAIDSATSAAAGGEAHGVGAPAEGNDRAKNRLLRGDEPFLRELGVSSPDGRVYDKKQPKFRQICRFLEHIRDIEPRLPRDGVLRICDLCCGKSYLSFAVYHYFAVMRGRRVSMTGVDLKPDVIEYCTAVAKRLGYEGLEFICGDVLKYESSEHGAPQLVVSLHACDVATDIVLTKAAQWRAEVILSTPCCHHALANIIDCPELSFVTDHPFLSRKLCDVLTDAARLSRLSAEGYDVTALELTDPDDTPKNVLLRAVRESSVTEEELARRRREYLAVRRFLAGAADPREALPDIVNGDR